MKTKVRVAEWMKVGGLIGLFWGIFILIFGSASIVQFVGLLDSANGIVLSIFILVYNAIGYGIGAFITQFIGFKGRSSYWKIYQVAVTFSFLELGLRIFLDVSYKEFLILFIVTVISLLVNLIDAWIANFIIKRNLIRVAI